MNTKQREWLAWGAIAVVLTLVAVFLGVTYPAPAAPGGEIEVLGTTLFDALRVTGASDLRGTVSDGAGTFTIGDDVQIAGAADAIQLRLTGYTTQTASLLVLEQAGGTDVMTVDANGNLYLVRTADIQGDVYDGAGDFTIADNAVITGTSDLQGNVADSLGTFTIADDASVTGAFGVTGASTLGGAVTVNDNVVITGTTDMQGNVADSAGDFTVDDNLDVTGNLDVSGSTTLGGVLLTASITEVNQLDGSPLGDHTFTIGSELTNTINVAIQLVDGNGVALAARGGVYAYLSNDANGDSIATSAPSGGVVVGTDGLAIPVTPALTNALLVDGNLAISATAEEFKTTQTSAYLIGGVSHTKAATDNLTFSAAHVITASKFGVILVQIDAAGNISTKVPGSPQAYDDAPTALAALPAADAGNIALGYIAIENNAGDWTANTDDLTNASDVTTATFTDTTEGTVAGAKAWTLISESDGDIDITITEAGAATWYLILVQPDGTLVASGAITFAP